MANAEELLIDPVAPVHFPTHEFAPITGGIGIYIEELARATATAGVPVTVWAPGSGEDDPGDGPFDIRRIRMRPAQDWLCRWRMGRAIARAHPEGRIRGTVVLAEPGPLRWWMYRCISRPPTAARMVAVLHGSELRHLKRLPHRRFLLGKLLGSCDCIGVVSEMVRDEMQQVYPILGDRCVVVHGAVRSAWSGLPPASHEERRKTILHVGRIHPRKGQLDLLEAFALLPDSLRQDWQLRLVGPVNRETYAGKIKAMAGQRGLKVAIEGELDTSSLRQAYEEAALCVLPSQPYKDSVEGLGMALLEAQHFGCPVIGTRVGGIPEALADGVTGWLVEPGSSKALANRLAGVLSDDAARRRAGDAAAVFVRERFSWSLNAERLGLV